MKWEKVLWEYIEKCGFEIEGFKRREIFRLQQLLNGYDLYTDIDKELISFEILDHDNYECIDIRKIKTKCSNIYALAIIQCNPNDNIIPCCYCCKSCDHECSIADLSDNEREELIFQKKEEWLKQPIMESRPSWKYFYKIPEIVTIYTDYLSEPHRHYIPTWSYLIVPLTWSELKAFLTLKDFILSLI